MQKYMRSYIGATKTPGVLFLEMSVAEEKQNDAISGTMVSDHFHARFTVDWGHVDPRPEKFRPTRVFLLLLCGLMYDEFPIPL